MGPQQGEFRLVASLPTATPDALTHPPPPRAPTDPAGPHRRAGPAATGVCGRRGLLQAAQLPRARGQLLPGVHQLRPGQGVPDAGGVVVGMQVGGGVMCLSPKE